MSYDRTTDRIIEAARKMRERQQKAQELVDRLAKSPHYRKYVREHKLRLINSNLSVFDKWLDDGVLKTPGRRRSR